MRRIRVMVVDDVAIVRRLVTNALAGDPAVEVVGTAANGREALEKIPAVRPDLVILDYEMPEMDGMETLKEIRKLVGGPRVIFFSSYTRQGAKVSMDALWQGADDYATKATADNPAAAMQCVQTELLPKIKALCAREASSAVANAAAVPSSPTPAGAASSVAGLPSNGRADIIAIGASTGGPRALSTIVEALPADFPIPIVVVQHMPPLFTKSLAERLMSRSKLRCVEAVDGMVAEPGTVWIAPGNWHMTVEKEGADVRLRLSGGPPENSCRPSVDPLFRSVAEVYGPTALGVLLTGMGQDGLLGARRVRERQGRILVQDEATSVVWGMPGAVARAGLAAKVLPLQEIAGEIVRCSTAVGRRRTAVG